MACPRGLGGRG
ncbi:hypothetical protein LINPERHAP2_LOCUS14238 [Linum perenne]